MPFKAAARSAGRQIEALTAGLQKVSAQLEVSKPAPQTVLSILKSAHDAPRDKGKTERARGQDIGQNIAALPLCNQCQARVRIFPAPEEF